MNGWTYCGLATQGAEPRQELAPLDGPDAGVWDGAAALDRLEHELFLARFFGLYGDVMPRDEVLARFD